MTSTLNTLAGLIRVMELKDRIREAMEAAKLSPADLARATGSTNAAVSFWLDGTTKSLRAEKAAKIETATGYRSQWVVSEKGPKRALDAPAPPDYTPAPQNIAQAMQVLTEALERVDPVKRQAVKAYLAGICDSPDRRDYQQEICHALEPPSFQTMPETGSQRAAA